MTEVEIRTGLKVSIRRNDGRTHPAIVAAVDENSRHVAVEWYEDGEPKGKEIDFETVISLNPTLWGRGGVPARSRSAVGVFGGCRAGGEEGDLWGREVPRSSSSSQSLLEEVAPVNIPTAIRRPTLQNGNPIRGELPKHRKLNQPNARSSLRPPSTTAPDRGSRTKRKSTTVLEVEKLQRNRALRRIRQAEQKEEREALQSIHSGNPNWQFQAMIKDYQEKLEFKPLTECDEATESHQITVCVRKRPLNRKEKLWKEVDVISVPRKNLVVVHEPKNKVDLTKYLENQQFRFDYAFDEMCTNETVYNFCAKPLVDTIFEGGMATCFAYGQTGSGKTHTMGGGAGGGQKGIYAMVAYDVFQQLQRPEHEAKQLSVSSSYYEIYGGKVYDLLAKKAKLRVLEDGKQQVQIVGLTERTVRSVQEVLSLIETGNNARTSGKTSANSSSSRSHAIFQITLRQGNREKTYGRIHLIDLAGNERGADTSSASRTTRLEGAEINKSLLALKECIRALGRRGAHLPFRGSTLTLVLRDSFIGDKTKTCMIAMISPGLSSCEHSINTLRYADRVKELASAEALIETPPPPVPPLDESRLTSSPTLQLEETFAMSDEETEEDLETSGLILTANSPECPLTPPSSSPVPSPSQSPSPTLIHKSAKLLHLEADMITAFHRWAKLCPKLDEQEAQLLLHRLESDSSQFAANLDQLLSERQKCLSAVKDRVTAFRLQIASEEDLTIRDAC